MNGGAWSTYPAWSTTSLGVAGNIDSPNLGNFRELLVTVKGLGMGVGTPDFLLQLSADGITYDADPTHYIHGGAAATPGFCFAGAVPIASTPALVSANIELLHFNLGIQTWARIRGGRENSTLNTRVQGGYQTQATPWKHIRITNTTATPWTANAEVAVYTRQPA